MGNRTLNLGVSGQCSNHLSHPARAYLLLLLILPSSSHSRMIIQGLLLFQPLDGPFPFSAPGVLRLSRQLKSLLFLEAFRTLPTPSTAALCGSSVFTSLRASSMILASMPTDRQGGSVGCSLNERVSEMNELVNVWRNANDFRSSAPIRPESWLPPTKRGETCWKHTRVQDNVSPHSRVPHDSGPGRPLFEAGLTNDMCSPWSYFLNSRMN